MCLINEQGDMTSTDKINVPTTPERQRVDPADSLAAMRDRLRRSMIDPRPDLSEEAVERRLEDLHVATVGIGGGAKT